MKQKFKKVMPQEGATFNVVNPAFIGKEFIHALKSLEIPFADGLISPPNCVSPKDLTLKDLSPLEDLKSFLAGDLSK
ncbi:MAG TPA: hypothetical protein PKE69_21465 [Pyrinomonadaceae bacterium]|nr:hypothetical protein [Pyrinomonadaceae bacterium]